MNKKEEILLAKQFYNRFNGDDLSFQVEEEVYQIRAVIPRKFDVPYDISINIINKIVAVLEFKKTEHLSLFNYEIVEKYAQQNNIRFYVITDGTTFKVTDLLNETRDVEYNYDRFIDIITTWFKGLEKPEVIKDEIARLFTESLYDLYLNQPSGSNIRPQQIRSSLEYDPIENTFYFKDFTALDGVEYSIFSFLLKTKKNISKIYRYTTIGSIFSTLNYNSYRMNGIVGMNDTTEISYAEDYIYGTKIGFSTAHWRTIEAHNNRFISSCTLLKDDLTMYRLYSDDSRGVCLSFNVVNIDEKNDFILKRVSYARADGSHPELELLKNILAKIKTSLRVVFRFKGFAAWKHFFKPYEYHSEDEVRLLYIRDSKSSIDKDWLITESHNIINPYVQFILNTTPFPLELDEIILGPKCSEKDVNLRQFEQLIRELRNKPNTNLNKLKCSLSKIKSYR